MGNSGRLAQARRFCAGFQVSLGRLAAFRFLARLSLGGVGVQRRAVRQLQVGRGRSTRLTARCQADTVGASASGLIRSLIAEQRIAARSVISTMRIIYRCLSTQKVKGL